MRFELGERVRLRREFARALMRSKTCKIDWLKRRGIVDCLGQNAIGVMWEGRTSKEYIDAKGLESDERLRDLRASKGGNAGGLPQGSGGDPGRETETRYPCAS
jgi:hypothetical protein